MADYRQSPEFPKHPFLLSAEETAEVLRTDTVSGLNSSRVTQLQSIYPKNELQAAHVTSPWKILAKMFFNPMILILVFSMCLSYCIKDYVEGSILAVVIILNVGIAFWQDYRAHRQMDSLRALSSPSAMVLRDGRTRIISNPEVVPGDIVLLKTGDTVPADLRIFESMNLSCEESQLTGESVPVDKFAHDIPPTGDEADTSIGDRFNMVYATTVVKTGRGQGIVTHTGMSTEVGKVASTTNRRHRKAGRSVSYRKYGKRQFVMGLGRRLYDATGVFLGLTGGTPLQRRLSILAYLLFLLSLILATIVFAVNSWSLDSDVVIYAISIGIAIIPESLVAVLTITMVVAVTVMRRSNVVVRDMSALEALGNITNICSDKTGTLTEGAMIVRNVWLPGGHEYTVHESQDPQDPTQGHVTHALAAGDALPPAANHPEEGKAVLTDPLRLFTQSTALCNLATVRYTGGQEGWRTTGEPTEIALQVFSHRFGQGKKSLSDQGWRQAAEFPFDSNIKRMSVIYEAPPEAGDYLAPGGGADAAVDSYVFTKGAVERVLDLCDYVGTDRSPLPMTDAVKKDVLEQMIKFASKGQRVLAVAYKPWAGAVPSPGAAGRGNPGDGARLRAQAEHGLTLLGLAGIYDPPRRETRRSIAECANAGIRVHMLTGDHPETAAAIAKEVGIIPTTAGLLPDRVERSLVQKASSFDGMTDAEMDALEELPLVIARCAPETKTRMMDALARRDAFTAMTGDGVNDAPSLSRADVGIAMGSGSDVAKSASEMVLSDDRFSSIVSAVREGRRMFDNIQKFVLHMLVSNIAEIILLMGGLRFIDSDGMSVFPISPLHIIWVNMATSLFPTFGLGREPACPEVMGRGPRCRKRGLFTDELLADMLLYGAVMGSCSLATFWITLYMPYWRSGVPDRTPTDPLGHDCNESWNETCHAVFRARAATFAVFALLILLSAWEFKSPKRSLFSLSADRPSWKDLYANRFLFWSVSVSSVSIVPVVYIPHVNLAFFKHRAISWEWGVVAAFLLLYLTCVEMWKLVKRHFGLFPDRPVHHASWDQGSSSVCCVDGNGNGNGNGKISHDGELVNVDMDHSSFRTWTVLPRRLKPAVYPTTASSSSSATFSSPQWRS
ncbi:P-type Na+/K+ transporter [Geosmithia morbida]|uniref:P-type Na(+) transporter n=1 Tax=Geosmithia morbida TaxID=1094350 RepID=A0A9P5D756_9HYPO|nr:P-type Na+/K+ transporter [Geosmithia morbida]KAF4125450.1 P-type Na+/K+ transporter [Geosmithia morbida]